MKRLLHEVTVHLIIFSVFMKPFIVSNANGTIVVTINGEVACMIDYRISNSRSQTIAEAVCERACELAMTRE